MVTGLKTKRFWKATGERPVSAVYFLEKEPMMVGVVMSSMVFECIIFWKIPASWSAWQWLRMHLSMRFGGMPNSARFCL